MNILHLVDEPYDSGIVHYALTAASGLQERGHSIYFGGRAEKYPLKEAARRGFKTLAITNSPSGIYALRRFLRKEKIGLINAHTGSTHALAVAATRFLSRPSPVVRTRADSRPLQRRPFSTLLWRRTDGFIAPAQYIYEQFSAAFPRLSIQKRVVLPGIEDPCKSGMPQDPPTDGPIRIGIVARLDPVKGHAYFLKAAAKILKEFPNTVFVLVGREENVRAKYLHSIASGLGIIKSVEFLGHVPDPIEIMRMCHIGVVTSIGSEAISRAALEWMSVARPLVASSVGCLPEIVADGKTGFLVSPMDINALTQRLIEILENTELRRNMGQAARRRYAAHFTLPRLIDETEKFYEDILHPVSSR